MSKMVCIYPKDKSTDFLFPLYEHLCSMDWEGFHEDTTEYCNKQRMLVAIENASNVIFLGHGCSNALYGTPLNGELTDFISDSNIDLIRAKRLLLLSCRSQEFCEYYDLRSSIGFGNMPTSIEDVRAMREDDVSFPSLEVNDINVYNNAIVRSTIKATSRNSFANMNNIHSELHLFINMEIVNCLLEKPCEKYRAVADQLQNHKNDCCLFNT